ncbi:MAG: 50S ribosomal protein L20 [Planctomycetota bacterium]|nr:MAG: 50S ribosomal protein L20 [Planctomycetota bacterium]
MRVTNAVPRHKRKKKIMKKAEGYRGGRSKLLRTAKEQVVRAGQYAYRDRKRKKRDFRKLWIMRINGACRQRGLSYSQFIHGLNKAGVEINRKWLSEIAISNPGIFDQLVEKAKSQLSLPLA